MPPPDGAKRRQMLPLTAARFYAARQRMSDKNIPRAEFSARGMGDSQTGTEEGIAYFLFQRPLLCRLAGAQNPARFRSALRFPFQALMHPSATQFPVKMYGIAPFSCGYSRFLRLCGIFRSFKMQKSV